MSILLGPTALLIAGGVSAGISAIGTIQSAKAQAKIGEYNARVAERDAVAAKQQSEYEADILRRQKEKTLGRQRALYAKSGVRVNEDSPLLVASDTAAEYEMDILNTLRTGTIQAQRYQSQADILRAQAKQTKRAGYLKAGTSLLTEGIGLATTYGLQTGKIKFPGSSPNFKLPGMHGIR